MKKLWHFWLLWSVLFLAGSLFAGILLWGLTTTKFLTDERLSLVLSEAQEWQTTDFHLWGSGQYRLFLESYSPTPPYDPALPDEAYFGGPAFQGRIEVRITAPSGEVLLQKQYNANDLTDHRLRGSHWTRLAQWSLEGLPLQSWKLEGRVLKGDPQFEGVRAHLIFRKDRPELGLAVVLLYIMVVPALLFYIPAMVLAARHIERYGYIPVLLPALMAGGCLWVLL